MLWLFGVITKTNARLTPICSQHLLGAQFEPHINRFGDKIVILDTQNDSQSGFRKCIQAENKHSENAGGACGIIVVFLNYLCIWPEDIREISGLAGRFGGQIAKSCNPLAGRVLFCASE
jgi:hypothetical protein